MTELLSRIGTSTFHRLRGGRVEIILANAGDGLPTVLHWGALLTNAEPDQLALASSRQVSFSSFDAPWPLTILPVARDGWEGRPAIVVHEGGGAVSPRWTDVEIIDDDQSIEVRAHDAAGRLDVVIRLELDEHGVLRILTRLTNLGTRPLDVAAIEATMPVGDRARESLDFAGRWTRERTPQRGRLLGGSRVRESRRGRTGHDAPLLLAVGEPGFTDTSGEVWAAHLAWSGDAVYRTDVLPESTPVIGCGPLLQHGEMTLQPGQSYSPPVGVFIWSETGLDGIAERLHRSLRARPTHPVGPRPVTLNTWEAVYFQHGMDQLTTLANRAADLGVERFVLDDGWFLGRRHDRTGLGDWEVDPVVWPQGLKPLADLVRGLGMQFGLWFEPEMVSQDSALIQEHPEWLLEPLENEPRTWRHQYLLDFAKPEVFSHLLESVSGLVSRLKIDFIKWDMNRDVADAVHAGRAGVVRHTEAVYALMDALRSRHPGLEIESCASGGGRVDLGVIEHTDRVWPSDTNDPVERLDIQRGTELLLPPELIGTHVGPERAHTTHRSTDLEFRIAAAFIGSFGIEWDISGCTPGELDQLRSAISAYKRLRPVLHGGTVYHGDGDDDGVRVTSVVAGDQSSAIVRVARVATSERSLPPLLRVTGLIEDASYRVAPIPELRVPTGLDVSPPPWLERGELTLTGAALARHGLRLPLLAPAQALMLEIERADT